MKFLVVLNIGFDRPGPSVHLMRSMIEAGLQRGHDMHVILMDTHGELPPFPESFAKYPNLHCDYIEAPADKKPGFIVRYLREIEYAFKCRKVFMKQGGYDAVFLQSCNTGLFYLLTLKALRCPVLFNVQDIFPYNLKLSGQLPLKEISFPILRKLQNMAYRRSDMVVTISEDMKQTLVDDGVEAEKVGVIFNWSYADDPISLASIDPENRKDLMIGNGKFNVVYAGNIGKMQNVEIIAEAARLAQNHRDIRFYIIGDGANKANIEAMTSGLENVEILPMQPSRYAESIYAQASVNIIPLSKGGIYTALPSKTATCLRTEVPIIFCIDGDSHFSKLAAQYDTVQIASCDDPAQLLEKILILKEQAGEYTTTNFDFFREHFTADNAEKYIRIMEELAQNAK